MGSINTYSSMENASFVLRSVKHVEFEDRAKPKLRDEHDVLVHVAQTGICGSDVHYWQRGRIGDYVVTGPMISGLVIALPWNLGFLVAATPPHDGTLAKYYVNASDYCYKIPDSMDMEEAAMVEPVAVACAVSSAAEIKAHQTVLVLGCGPIGVLCQAVAKQWGASRVIGVDVVAKTLEVAKSFGADEVYLPPKPEPNTDLITHAQKVAAQMNRELGLGDGPDVVLECSGAEPCVQLGVYAVKKGGTFVQAGMGKEIVSFSITTVCIKGLKIQGSIRYRPGSYRAAIELISTGKIDVKKLITNRYPFEQAEEAFKLVQAGRHHVFKVLIAGVE